MFDDSRSFISRSFLRAEFDLDYRAYTDERDAALLSRLTAWADRLQLRETSAEGAFTQTFFVELWGYGEAGRVDRESVTLIPKLPIVGEGAGGGKGEADLALGWFRENPHATPQVLCEFKDIRSALDAPQPRKGNTRSPVKQCLDYVRGARRGLFGNEPVQPWWGVVTDMNEFRLYWWDRAPAEYMRFVISRHDLLTQYDLLSAGEEARFDRFLFWKLFQRDQLLSQAGRPPLLRLIERQGGRQRALEGEFYDRYKGVRERLFQVLMVSNPRYRSSPTELLRLSQKLLDRFIFAFYCEDMGQRMLFPPDFIRDYLTSRSREPFYDPNGDELWTFFKRLFELMNDGGPFGSMRVPKINGGLFASDPEIDALSLPNHVFAAPGQGANDASLERDKETLLHLCARYNYAARGSARESLSLYTLGRIFEQSITELEYRAGELEARDSIAKLSKRKRDGVYYTPEWVVNRLVENTLAPWFQAAKQSSGWPEDLARLPTRQQVIVYEARLKQLRLVDPACGSGAFLISAFRRLLDERTAVEELKARFDPLDIVGEAALTADILENNVYGVDINPAAVEIAKLALWLHSARADAPLSSLDHTLRCGNSLVGPEYWVGRTPDDTERARVNAFAWREAFPEIWSDESAGFDIVLGNPPYVKLQNLHAVDPGIASWLQANRGADTYLSAQTGNFDLYLPFIEKGLRLLAPGGRMAYIAPSLWTVNRYGEGLRRLLRRTRQLESWIDFKAHQIFNEVTTYTALQFFTRGPQDDVRIAAAPDGEASDVDWSDSSLAVPYAAFDSAGEWLMATGAERALIDRLAASCPRLDDRSLTTHIFQGLITSADAIYHLQRLGHGRYRCSPKKAPSYEVFVEDQIMKPLVSGAEAKRYEEPLTDTFLLFPYERDQKGVMRLMSRSTLEGSYPKAWAYLRSWETQLRTREKDAFDDATWWRFGRSQNIDKQDVPKLIVAETVPEMRVCADTRGDKYLNNVRVNGILTAEGIDPFFLLGALNGSVANFVFRRIGKPKAGGYFEANKQFIAPLPVPGAGPADRADVASMARELQARWSSFRDLVVGAGERLSVLPRANRQERWLWPDLSSLADVEAGASTALKLASERRDWARARLNEEIAARVEALQARLEESGPLEAAFREGELALFVSGAPVLARIYLDQQSGEIARAYWSWLFLTQTWRDAARLTTELRRPPAEAESAAARQFISRVAEIETLVAEIEGAESELNERLFDLYDLTAEERLLVDNPLDRRARR